MRPPRSTRLLAVLAAIFTVTASLLAPSPIFAGLDKGDRVEIAGTVTDSEGRPVQDVEVAIVASRRQLNFLRLRMENRDPIRVKSRTNADGAYRLEWIWDRSYNRFDFQVGFDMRLDGVERFQKLHGSDLSLRIAEGGPIVLPVVLEDIGLLANYRSFLKTVRSEDEKRVFDSAGRPDRIERGREGETQIVEWWFFDQGKVYRFENGLLTEVTDFDPVESFDGKSP